jgi:hypothetical protein
MPTAAPDVIVCTKLVKRPARTRMPWLKSSCSYNARSVMQAHRQIQVPPVVAEAGSRKRTPMGTCISVSLTVELTADSRIVDAFTIFLAAPNCLTCVERSVTQGYLPGSGA